MTTPNSKTRPPPSLFARLTHALPSSLLLHCLLSIGALPRPCLAAGKGSESVFGPWHEFKTEPTFKAAILNFTRPDHLAPELRNRPTSDEHIFLTLRSFRGWGPWGPQIFDHEGNLVFYSEPDVTTPALAIQDPHICSYLSSDGVGPLGDQAQEGQGTHLCVSEAVTQTQGHLDTIPRIYNASYVDIGAGINKYNGVKSLGIADGHEFHVLAGGHSFLNTLYPKKKWDLSGIKEMPPHKKPPGRRAETPHEDQDKPTTEQELGPTQDDNPIEAPERARMEWVHDGCFREGDMKTRNITFEWCFLDHYSPKETIRALENYRPWDFAHINSADKDANGDYLISLKFIAQLIKIAGRDNIYHPPGTPIWRLGGKNSDFAVSDELKFLYQHHARFVSSTFTKALDGSLTKLETESVSVFDNHCANHWGVGCDLPSMGKIIQLNHTATPPSATLVQSYPHPDGKFGWAGGNVQLLKNGNVWVGWGQVPEATEFDRESGQVLRHVYLGASDEAFMYRAPRGKWVGKPMWSPKAFAYSQDCGLGEEPEAKSPGLRLWVSWNGATEVKSWRVETSSTAADGPWTSAGTYDREGFETEIMIPFGDASRNTGSTTVPRHIRATALDASGSALPNGETGTELWVPPYSTPGGVKCTDTGCSGKDFNYTQALNDVNRCQHPGRSHTQMGSSGNPDAVPNADSDAVPNADTEEVDAPMFKDVNTHADDHTTAQHEDSDPDPDSMAYSALHQTAHPSSGVLALIVPAVAVLFAVVLVRRGYLARWLARNRGAYEPVRSDEVFSMDEVERRRLDANADEKAPSRGRPERIGPYADDEGSSGSSSDDRRGFASSNDQRSLEAGGGSHKRTASAA